MLQAHALFCLFIYPMSIWFPMQWEKKQMISCCIMDRKSPRSVCDSKQTRLLMCFFFFFTQRNVHGTVHADHISLHYFHTQAELPLAAVLEKSPLLQTKEKRALHTPASATLQVASLSRLPLSSCTFSCSLCCPLLLLTPPRPTPPPPPFTCNAAHTLLATSSLQ